MYLLLDVKNSDIKLPSQRNKTSFSGSNLRAFDQRSGDFSDDIRNIYRVEISTGNKCLYFSNYFEIFTGSKYLQGINIYIFRIISKYLQGRVARNPDGKNTSAVRETGVSWVTGQIIIINNGLIFPLYPVLCCFKRDFYSVSSGSRDISVLLSFFQFLFIYFIFFRFVLFSFLFSSSLVSLFYLVFIYLVFI